MSKAVDVYRNHPEKKFLEKCDTLNFLSKSLCFLQLKFLNVVINSHISNFASKNLKNETIK